MYLANVLIGSFAETVAVLKKKLLKKREGPRINACTVHSKREQECLLLFQGICIVVFIYCVCDAFVCHMYIPECLHQCMCVEARGGCWVPYSVTLICESGPALIARKVKRSSCLCFP